MTFSKQGNKTLDLFYANFESYNAEPLTPLGKSDHYLVSFQPIYKPCSEAAWLYLFIQKILCHERIKPSLFPHIIFAVIRC